MTYATHATFHELRSIIRCRASRLPLFFLSPSFIDGTPEVPEDYVIFPFLDYSASVIRIPDDPRIRSPRPFKRSRHFRHLKDFTEPTVSRAPLPFGPPLLIIGARSWKRLWLFTESPSRFRFQRRETLLRKSEGTCPRTLFLLAGALKDILLLPLRVMEQDCLLPTSASSAGEPCILYSFTGTSMDTVRRTSSLRFRPETQVFCSPTCLLSPLPIPHRCCSTLGRDFTLSLFPQAPQRKAFFLLHGYNTMRVSWTPAFCLFC